METFKMFQKFHVLLVDIEFFYQSIYSYVQRWFKQN